MESNYISSDVIVELEIDTDDEVVANVCLPEEHVLLR
jgi:Arc/MetJ family transcription regulator